MSDQTFNETQNTNDDPDRFMDHDEESQLVEDSGFEVEDVVEPLDLASLESNSKIETGAWMDVRHPVTGNPTGARIRLFGLDSVIAQKIIRENQNARFKMSSRKGGRFRITAEVLDQEALNLIVGVTAEWEDMVHNGKPIPYDKKTVRSMYMKHRWLRNQAEEYVDDRANFLGG